MKIEILIRMANEIARNLRTQPGNQAASATAEHIRSFWTPGMRADLIAHTRTGGEGLDEIALEAATFLPDPADDQSALAPEG